MVNNEKSKLQNITEDMKRIVQNINTKEVETVKIKL